MVKNVVLKQPENPEEQVTVEIIASSLVAIAEGVKKLRAGPLNERALVLLIQHATPTLRNARGYAHGHVTAKQIQAVLDGMESLKSEYLK